MGPAKARLLSLVYAATLCVVLLSAFTLYRNIGTRSAAVDRMSHTQQVMLQLAEIHSLITDAETGQRGYLLTGDKAYLLPYEAARARIEPAFASLADLTSDSPRQQARIVQLRGAVSAKMTELGSTIELFEQGKGGESLQIVHSNLGREVMEQIRGLMGEMQAEETHLLAERQAALRRGTQLFVTIALSTALNLLLLLVIAGLHAQRMAHERAAAEQIRIREEQFRTALTSIGDAVITTDAEGRVTFVNSTAETLLGKKLADCVRRPLQEVFPIYNEQTGNPAENPVHRVLASGQVSGLANHTVIRREDGTQVPIEDSAAPIRDDRGEIYGVVLVFRDVSSERESQLALRRADRLMVAGRLAASVAHEINNPLEAVFNLIYLAVNDPTTPAEVREQLSKAIQELNRVAHVTRQALRFHRTEPGIAEVDLSALFDELLELFASRFSTREVAVERRYRTGVKVVISQDDLKQVLSNLLTNALDAMPNGGKLIITIAALTRGEKPWVRICVEDTGAGIAPGNRSRIFEPFFTTKAQTGTGLGLWVAKQLVEQHGGSIALHSPAGGDAGACFEVQLPEVSALRQPAGSAAAD